VTTIGLFLLPGGRCAPQSRGRTWGSELLC
jgi:hypothetical protein